MHDTRPRSFFLAVGLTIVLGACATRADVDDPTPPEVVLRYRFDAGTWIDVPAGGKTVAFDADHEQLYLWAVGTDSGGVKQVQIAVTGDVTCQNGLAKYSWETSVKETNSEDSSVGDGDRTESSRSVVMEFPQGRACDDDAHALNKGTLEFVALATNFASDTTISPTLTVTK